MSGVHVIFMADIIHCSVSGWPAAPCRSGATCVHARLLKGYRLSHFGPGRLRLQPLLKLKLDYFLPISTAIVLFAIFAVSVLTLELIMRYEVKTELEKSGATPTPSAALEGDTATMDLVRLGRALAGDGVTPLPERERPSSSHSAASPQEAADRSS
jgi:hypothetical protein